MAKITYHELHSGAASTVFHGVAFVDGVTVEVDHDDPSKWPLVDAALRNKFFEVTDVPPHDEMMEQRKEIEERMAHGEVRPHKAEIAAAKEAATAPAEEDEPPPEAPAPASEDDAA